MALLVGALPGVSMADHVVTNSEGGLVTSVRWSGETRYDTASKLAVEATAAAVSTPAAAAILATGRNFPDALAGSYLAKAVDAPILLTDRDSIPPETLARLTGDAASSLDVQTVYLLGGPVAISTGVETELTDLGFTVERLAGDDRVETAAMIATDAPGAVVGTVDGLRTAILSTSRNFPDALVAGATSFAGSIPLLLTDPGSLSPTTSAALAELGIQQVLVAGGPVAVALAVDQELTDAGYQVRRVQGESRYDTAIAFADFNTEELGFTTNEIGLSRGDNFPDALAFAPFAGREGFSITLTRPEAFPEATATYLTSIATCEFDTLYIPGGPVAVSEAVETVARQALTAANCEGVDNQAPSLTGADQLVDAPARAARDLPADGDDVIVLHYDEAVTCDGTAPFQFTHTHPDTDSGTDTTVTATSLECDGSDEVVLGFPADTIDPAGTITYVKSGDPAQRITDTAGNEATNNDTATIEVVQNPGPTPSPSPTPTPTETETETPDGEDFVVDTAADAVDAVPGDGYCSITTATDGDCSLRAAVMEANATPTASTITIPDFGEFIVLTIAGIDEDAAATGDLDILETLTITGENAESTRIDADGIDRVFDVISGDVTMTGVTITGGNIDGDNCGGGVNVHETATLDLSDATVIGNHAGEAGGGLSTMGGDLTVDNVDFIQNSTGGDAVGEDGDGGAIFSEGANVTVTGGSASNNSSVEGGAFWAGGADVTFTVDSVRVTGNTATDEGGAFYNRESLFVFIDVDATDGGHEIYDDGSPKEQFDVRGNVYSEGGSPTISQGARFEGINIFTDTAYETNGGERTCETQLAGTSPPNQDDDGTCFQAVDFLVDTTVDAPDETIDGVCATALAGPAEGACSLRAAIQEANSNVDSSAISVPDGTYALTITGADEDAAATGDLDVTSRLTIFGSSQDGTIIDGGALGDRVFHVNHASGLFRRLTITGGTADGGPTNNTDRGGGIFVDNADGFSSASGDLSLVTVHDNMAGQSGAGIANMGGYLYIHASAIDDNSAVNVGQSTSGGGVHSDKGIYIIDSEVGGNVADEGAGVWVSGANASSTRVAFTDNRATGAGGGAIYNFAASLTVNDSSFQRNTAEEFVGSGGAILTIDGADVLRDNTFIANRSEAGGGAIDVQLGTIEINDSDFTDNVATGLVGAGNGGAIRNTGDAQIYGGSATNNTAVEGGAFWNSGTMLVAGSDDNDIDLSLNVATGTDISVTKRPAGGGAVYNEVGTVDIRDAIFDGNAATGGQTVPGTGHGGAIANADGNVTVLRSSLLGNQGDRGGAVWTSGPLDLDIVTVTNNTATSQGGAFYHEAGDVSFSDVNAADGGRESDVSIEGNVYAATTPLVGSVTAQDTTFTDGPGLAEATCSAVISPDDASNTDDDDTCFGPVNAERTFTVDDAGDTSDDNAGDGVCDDGAGACTLRAAVEESNAVPGFDVINVPPGPYSLAGDVVGEIVITDDVAIDGQPGVVRAGPGGRTVEDGPVAVTIDGDAASRIFRIEGDIEVSIDQVILTNGFIDDGSLGGAVLVIDAQVALAEVFFDDNHVFVGGGQSGGGGLGLMAADVRMLGGGFTVNTAVSGGGVYLDGASRFETSDVAFEDNNAARDGGAIVVASPDGYLEVRDSVFTDNEASNPDATTGGGGGAIYGTGSTMIVAGSTFGGPDGGNRAFGVAASGGAIMITGGNLDVVDSRFEGNIAVAAGGAIDLFSGVLRVTDTDFVNNTVDVFDANPGHGGAVHKTAGGSAFVTGGTAVGNSAVQGGAFWSTGFRAFLVDGTTVTDNLASSEGGAFYSSRGYFVFRDVDATNGGLETDAVVQGNVYAYSELLLIQATRSTFTDGDDAVDQPACQARTPSSEPVGNVDDDGTCFSSQLRVFDDLPGVGAATNQDDWQIVVTETSDVIVRVDTAEVGFDPVVSVSTSTEFDDVIEARDNSFQCVSGESLCPRIALTLDPGTYYVLVEGFDGEDAGDYSLDVGSSTDVGDVTLVGDNTPMRTVAVSDACRRAGRC